MRWTSVLLLLLGVIGAGAARGAEERRVALIIGNDAYRSLPKLSNAANDARAMEHELKAAGFETTVKIDSGRREMNSAVNDFAGKLSTGAVGLFYFAGHGIQARDRNYLVPVDAQVDTEADLEVEAIDGGKVMRAMEEARNRLNIVILDACRDNPLPKGRSASRGLAVMAAPTGSFVAYSTAPGQIAQDGDKGANGVFTGELVKALREPGLKIEDVFKRAASGVREKTGGKQVPWVQASIQGDFYFRPGAKADPAPASVADGGGNNDGLFWSSIKDSQSAADFEAYLAQFPHGTFAALARNRLERLKTSKSATQPNPRPKPVRKDRAAAPTVIQDESVRECLRDVPTETEAWVKENQCPYPVSVEYCWYTDANRPGWFNANNTCSNRIITSPAIRPNARYTLEDRPYKPTADGRSYEASAPAVFRNWYRHSGP